MVLSMLSAIAPVKLQSSPAPPSSTSSSSGAAVTSSSAVTSSGHGQSDMSRRKQRNPKPVFSTGEENEDEKVRKEAEPEEKREKGLIKHEEANSNDEDTSPEDMSSPGPHNADRLNSGSSPSSPVSPPASSSPLFATPSTINQPSSGPILPQLPPLTPMPSLANKNNNNHKNSMLHLGDITLSDAAKEMGPVPLVLPMVYLVPSLSPEGGEAPHNYKLFVPMGLDSTPLGLPSFLNGPAAPPPPPPIPVSGMLGPSQLGKRKRKTSRDVANSGIPLDLSKSPENNGDHGGEAESNGDFEALRQREIEAHLNFLKVKQAEFLKSQQQQQNESRCEECNINFSKHQNYVAHKKYYCTGGMGGGNPKPKGSGGGNQARAATKSVSPTATSNSKNNVTNANPSSSTSSSPVMISPPLSKEMMLLKHQHELMLKNELIPPPPPNLLLNLPPPPPPPPAPTAPTVTTARVSPGSSASSASAARPTTPTQQQHFSCEGCGIKFKSGSNLQAHQARYCAGLRSKNDNMSTLEAIIKQQQHQQQQQPPFPLNITSATEMMSFLNAKSLEQQAKAAAAVAAALQQHQQQPQPQPSTSGIAGEKKSSSTDDFCCILCGYKENSVERLKDHINMHFIGQVKRPSLSEANTAGTTESQELVKREPSTTPTTAASMISSSCSPLKKRLRLDNAAGSSSDTDSLVVTEVKSPKHEVDDDESEQTKEKNKKTTSNETSIRCDHCDIGFAHLSNFLAHKKFYCSRAGKNEEKSKEKD